MTQKQRSIGCPQIHPQQPWGGIHTGPSLLRELLRSWLARDLSCSFHSLGSLLRQPPISPHGFNWHFHEDNSQSGTSRGDLSPGSHPSYLIPCQHPILVYKNRIHNLPHPPGSIPVNDTFITPQPCPSLFSSLSLSPSHTISFSDLLIHLCLSLSSPYELGLKWALYPLTQTTATPVVFQLPLVGSLSRDRIYFS